MPGDSNRHPEHRLSAPQTVTTSLQPAASNPAGRIAGTPVRGAIARAAEATGVDFSYLLAQARLESGLDPSARAPTSSAAGLYQFTKGTWLATLDRHGAEHGLGWADDAIANGRVTDPAMRAQVMALRFDPDASARMAAELARDNSAALSGVLGRAPDHAELYLAHFLGSGGAAKFLSALAADPGQSAASLLPAAAGANRAIFYDHGSPRSVAGVMELIRAKVDTAMAADGGSLNGGPFDGGSLPQGEWVQFADPALPGAAAWSQPARAGFDSPPSGQSPQARPSMAATLAATFGLASAEGRATAPRSVQAAYARLKGFDL